ncbi:hypothetical protein [Nostoc sp. 2RC]|uniref:hypothetical protein n=1 Tax=Nostoc sp. 2RC TaxID=2485484 RepID=UPI0016282642|nr:hypothetical protein [Nostoc sp. 2RC]MBC1235910.1 hypothetical protein [Nostoc sp. 2RC]
MAIEITPDKVTNKTISLNGLSVIWAGEWVNTKTYRKNQAVSYGGSSYRANKTTTQPPSSESVDWDVLALGSVSVEDTVEKDIYFSYGDVNSRLIYTTGDNEIILTVTIVIITPFNGVGASISIGDSLVNDRLANNSQIYLEQAGEYSVNPVYKYTSVTPINLYLNQGTGASQGNGYIIIESK